MLSFPMDTVLQITGEPATYTPDGGSPVDCYAKRVMAGREISIGPVRIVAETSVYHVSRFAVAAPAAGDTLEVGQSLLTIEAVEPAPNDPQRLLWQINADWGVSVEWKRHSGSGSTLHPPSVAKPKAAAAALGAAVLTINSTYAVGVLKSGDQFTVDGDLTVYTVQADVTADASGFVDVSISPVLASATVGGEAIELDSTAEVTIRGALVDYEAAEIEGAVQAGDRRLVLRASDMASVSRSKVRPGDEFVVDGETWRTAGARAVFEGGSIVAWDVRVQQ